MPLRTLPPRVAVLAPRLAPARTVNSDSWRSLKTSAQRGYGHKWRKAREGWLKAHPLCAYCEREGRASVATVVDHRTPHRGDMALFWDSGNWQSLCKSCHDSIKKREEHDAERRAAL